MFAEFEYLLEIHHATYLKEKPLNAKDLPDSLDYKSEVAAGAKFKLKSVGISRKSRKSYGKLQRDECGYVFDLFWGKAIKFGSAVRG